jgi:hypothetical protein
MFDPLPSIVDTPGADLRARRETFRALQRGDSHE